MLLPESFYPGDKLPGGYVIPKGGTEGDARNFSPRFGFAWDVGGNAKTSIRGGYGLYYDSPELYMLNNMNDHSPFSVQVEFLNGQFDNPYAGRESYNVFPFAGDFSSTTPFQVPVTVDALEHQFKLPYTQNWNLTLERNVRSDWLLRIGYVGTKTTHLMIGYDSNAPIYNFSETLSQNQNSINQRRPRPEYANLYILGTPLGQSYNGLQVSLNRRFSHGLTVLGSYTFSKNIDYNSTNNNVEDNTIADPFDFGHMRGVADSDHPHRFVGSFVWDLPDPGRPTGSKLLSAILGNWQMGGIVTLQSGSPFSLYSSGDTTAGAAKGPQTDGYADLIGNLSVAGDRSRGAEIAEYFNIAGVAQASPGTFGTLGRNVLRGPAFYNTDLNVSRAFPLRFREGTRILLRSEFFNLFNRPQLSAERSYRQFYFRPHYIN